jgi:mannose-6-phosphate isomerase-like protein (cupin superfamily)
MLTTGVTHPIKKPWGNYKVLLESDHYVVKELRLFPEQQFSLQKHEHRIEEWTILEGTGLITLGESQQQTSTFVSGERSRVMVPQGYIHRLKNTSKNNDLVVLEIWWSRKENGLSEEDIIRYEDDYDRVC